MFRLAFITLLIVAAATATEIKQCKSGKTPIAVRVKGCDKMPCNVIKGSVAEMEIDFTAGDSDVEQMDLKVRATALGITIPYPLPEEVANVCNNLMNEQSCPLDAGEDATYFLKFPIGSYPEIGVGVELTIKNQDGGVLSCFLLDIKVKSA